MGPGQDPIAFDPSPGPNSNMYLSPGQDRIAFGLSPGPNSNMYSGWDPNQSGIPNPDPTNMFPVWVTSATPNLNPNQTWTWTWAQLQIGPRPRSESNLNLDLNPTADWFQA